MELVVSALGLQVIYAILTINARGLVYEGMQDLHHQQDQHAITYRVSSG